ncbi:MAG: two-component system sensor histidine kinase NtrB [Acidobacteriaceae bacterium]
MLSKQSTLKPWNLTLSYGVAAVLWIWLSDVLLLHLALPARVTFMFAAGKGSLFVVITMFSLYWLTRRMVARVSESEERFSRAFRSNPEGVTISTIAEGRYVEANPAFVRMLGYAREDLLGKTSAELSVWVDQSHRQILLDLLGKGNPVQGYTTCFRNRKGDEVQVELSAERVSIAGNTCLLLLARDLRNEKRLERQFQQAQRMEALGGLAAAIAHDVRNQLMVIETNATSLNVRDEQSAGRLQHILSAVEKCNSLTRQLLAYSRKQEIRPEPLKVPSVISDFLTTIATVLGPSVNLVTDLKSTSSIFADPRQLEQLLMNLAVNARDAMPNGGTFRISASDLNINSDSDGAAIPKGPFVQLLISDTGHGMSAEVRTRVFEPFFTTKERGKGTGLGLAAVYGIVQQSGGHISVDSEVGVGTSFTIHWPAHIDARSYPVRSLAS